MCEAFSETFKREYVYQNLLDSEDAVKELIHGWVKDNNTIAPHSARARGLYKRLTENLPVKD